MSYQFESRVRYSEVDVWQNLTLNGIINYFQDCTTFDSENIGMGIERLKEKHCAWILSAWQIIVNRLPKFGEKITVQTWPYGFKAFYGDRNFAMLDAEGSKVAVANSVWVFMDMEAGRPVKLEPEQIGAYTIEEKLDMEYASRKIALPGELEEKESFPVLRHQLDTNHHVNNGQYVQMAQEFLPEGFQIRQMRAEYKKAAVLHDVIFPMVHVEKGSCTVALCNERRKPYAVIEFLEAQ